MKNTPHIVLFASVLLLGASAAYADPPARVGRLSDVEGTVSFRTQGEQDWSAATLNYPVTSGVSLWTEPGARTEIEIGGVELRMDQSTEIDVVRLDDSATQLNVPQGDVNVHLAATPPQPVQVETPRGEITLAQMGSYHIAAGPGGDPAAPVEVTVLAGSAQFQGRIIAPGHRAVIDGNGAVSIEQGELTSFDDWAASRDQEETAPQAANYVSPQTTGYQDLDRYGQWAPDPTYGNVWYPEDVDAGWTPYTTGHWVFVEPWGWTWVDDAPWGFAPFHYGRWVHVGHRWGWWPGEGAFGRPVYAPALVAFIGGTGWNIDISSGAIGWVPLAPYEPFHPYYHVSDRYVRDINIRTVHREDLNRIGTNNWHDSSHFANRGAMTVVHSDAFTHAQSVRNTRVSVPQAQISHAPVTGDVSHFRPNAARHAPAPHRTETVHANPNVAPGPNRRFATVPTPHAVTENRAPAPHPAARTFAPALRPEAVEHVEHTEQNRPVFNPAMHRPAVVASPEKLRAIPRLPANTAAERTPAARPTPRPYEVRHPVPAREPRANNQPPHQEERDHRNP